MIENLKPLYNATLRPVAKILHAMGLTPNGVTLVGTGISILAAPWIATGRWKTGMAFVVIGSLFDGLDGVLAREYDQKTKFGSILDSVCDRVTEIAWFGGLIWYYLLCTTQTTQVYGVTISFIALSLSVMVSYIKARCEGAGVTCNKGFMQRPERIIALCLLLLIGKQYMLYGLAALSVLAGITMVQRLLTAHRNCTHSA